MTRDADIASEAETLVVPKRPLSASTSQINPGIVLGSYLIIEEIGSGGVGRVYLAEHTILGRKVALKMLRSELCHDVRVVQRFFDEARSVNEIAHENIVTITDFVVGEGHPSYYIMELLEGIPLDKLLAEDGALSADLAIDIGLQLASALGAAHKKGVVHRDLKPANIFLVPRATGGYHVRLLDFGVAKFARREQGTDVGTLIGTPDYMSPEQTFGIEIDHRADLYSLGAVLYEMTTGVRPFVRETLKELLVAHRMAPVPPPRQIASQPMSSQLERIILSCMAKIPDDRPQTADEVRDLLLAARGRKKRSGGALMIASATAAACAAGALLLMQEAEPAAVMPPPAPAPIVVIAQPPPPPPPVIEAPKEAEVAAEKPAPKLKPKRKARRVKKSPAVQTKKIDRAETKDPFE